MRNLKRVLSLALASAMLLGMMVIGAGAADKTLTDLDKVSNKEAVNLMVDLGIIVGKPDGSFAPTETVDRATMSKLIYFIMMGDSDATVFKGISTPLTDVKGNWAEGFINYCYSVNIVAGTGNNTYNPNGKVTTVAAAKMLLVALGYDAKLSKYENDAMWSVNIMRDAQNAGLLKNVDQKASEELTRDNASQMIYNALFANTVTPKFQYDMGIKYLEKYESTTTTLAVTNYKGLARKVGVLTGVDASGYATVATSATISNTTALTTAAKVSASEADLGKLVAFYTQNNSKYASTAVVAVSSNKVYTIPSGLTEGSDKTVKDSTAAWLNTNSLTLSANDVNKIVDYSATAAAAVQADFAVANNATIAYAVDGNGDGTVDAIVKNTVILATVSADVKTKTVSGETTVYVPGVNTSYTTVEGYEGLAKNDIVMYSVRDGVYSITKCDSIVGKITGTTGSKIVIDGTSYKISGIAQTAFNTVTEYTDLGYGKDITFWLDANGNLVSAKLVTGATAANLAVVLKYAKDGSDLFGNQPFKAQILKTDGTVEIITVANITEDTTKKVAGDGTASTNNLDTNDFIAYSQNTSGTYDATVFNTTADTLNNVSYVAPAAFTTTKSLSVVTGLSSDKNYAIKNNVANFLYEATSTNATTWGTAAPASGIVGNNDTIFVVTQKNSDGDVTGYKTYTGIANVPAMADVSTLVLKADGIAKVVYVTTGSGVAAENTGSIMYLPSDATLGYVAKNGDVAAYWTYTAFENGVATTVKMNDAAKGAVSVGNTYFTSVDGDMITAVKAIAEYTDPDALVGVKYEGGLIVAGTSETAPNYYTITDSTKVYVIDAANKLMNAIAPSAIETDSNDTVGVKLNSTKTTQADVVIITKAAVAAPTAQYAVAAPFSGTTALANGNLGAKVVAGDKLSFKVTAAKGSSVTVTVNGTSVTKLVSGAATDVTFNALYTATATDAAVATGSVVYTVTVTVADGTGAPSVTSYTLKNVAV